jgi:hypothetical protein
MQARQSPPRTQRAHAEDDRRPCRTCCGTGRLACCDGLCPCPDCRGCGETGAAAARQRMEEAAWIAP